MYKKYLLIFILFAGVFSLTYFSNTTNFFSNGKTKFISEDKEIKKFTFKHDEPLEALKFDYEKRAYPLGFIPADWRTKAFEHIKNFNTNYFNKASSLTFQSVGPNNIAGRTRTIRIDPNNSNIIYVGAASGGVWKSTNGGDSWISIGDFIENLAVCALEIDPKNSNIIYAGTGEGYYNFDAVRGEGIFKSTNGGVTWSQLTSTKNLNFYYVNDLKIDKATNILWAATNNGLYYSPDGGSSWNSAPQTPANYPVYCNDLEITDTNPSTIYACYGLFSKTTIYRSTNSGASFEQIYSLSSTGRADLAISPSNPLVIYASFMDLNTNACGKFIKSTNGGNSFFDIQIPGPSMTYSTYTGPQAWYNNIVAVSPLNSNYVYAGGVDLFISQDGGNSWTQKTNWYDGTPIQYVHADHHEIQFAPNDPYTFYLGTDGGVFKTTNGGLTFTEKSAGMITAQFYAGATHPTQNIFYGGTQDNGTLKTNIGMNWRAIIGGDGGFVEVDYLNSNIVYGEYVKLTFYKSTDGGKTFFIRMSGIPYGVDPEYGTTDRVSFIAPFVMDPNNPQILVAGTYKVYRTTNGADYWTPISGDLTGDGTGSQGAVILALAIAKNNSNIIFAGCSNGRIQRTTNTGSNWTIVSASLPQLSVTDIEIDPNNTNIVYVTYSGFSSGNKVYRSTNLGSTWTNVSGDLPNVPVNTILISPYSSEHLIIGTDIGIFSSTNGGINWIKENNGIGNVRVDDLDLRKSDNAIIVATHGRGMYKAAITSSILEAVKNKPEDYNLKQNYPNPFNPSTIIEFSIPTTSETKLEIFDINGKLVNVLYDGILSAGTYRMQWNGKNKDGENVSSGTYIYNLTSGNFRNSKKMTLIR